MKYTLYTKRVENIIDEVEEYWMPIGTNMSLDSVIIFLDEIVERPESNDYVFTIVPEVGEGDKVLNKNNQDTGIVIQMDINPDTKFVTVRNSEGNILTWVISELMVIG